MELEKTHQILIDVLTLDPGLDKEADFQSIPAPEWDRVVQSAVWFAVAAPLYERVKRMSITGLTSEARKRLKTLYHYNHWNNTGLYAKLQLLLKEMNAKQVPVIALKGAHLIPVVYQNLALRTMSDIDLLIHKEDMERTGDILTQLGYENTCDQDRYDDIHFHYIYQLNEPGFKSYIELHWDLHYAATPIKIDLEKIWERAQQETIAHEKTLVLCAEDFVLHQCLHLAVQHCFLFGIRPLYDLKETILHYQAILNWDEFLDRVRESHLEKGVYLTLFLVRELMQAPIPERVIEALQPQDLDQLIVDSALANILSTKSTTATRVSRNMELFLPGSAFMARTRKIVDHILLSPEIMRKRYFLSAHSWWVWFYYPVRIKDVIVRHLRTLFRIVKKDPAVIAQIKQEKEWNKLRNWLNELDPSRD